MRRFLLVIALIITATKARAADTERFLVPIYLPGAVMGAFGSVWVSELRILNAGSAPAAIENFGPMCLFDPCLPLPLPPGVSIRGNFIRGLQGSDNPGALLVVGRERARQFVFQLRIRDISRADDRWGTWLPVVHESESVAGPVHLLNIPIDARYRQMLRVYSFDSANGGQVRVRVFRADPDVAPPYPENADALLAELVLSLRTGSSTQPAYADFPNIGQLPGVAGHSQVRLSVEVLGAFRMWPMVSVTNNATQEVTMVVPNRRID